MDFLIYIFCCKSQMLMNICLLMYDSVFFNGMKITYHCFRKAAGDEERMLILFFNRVLFLLNWFCDLFNSFILLMRISREAEGNLKLNGLLLCSDIFLFGMKVSFSGFYFSYIVDVLKLREALLDCIVYFGLLQKRQC